MFNHIFGPRVSGGYGDKSGGGFCYFLIVLISFMGVNVVISQRGDDRQRPGEQGNKKTEKHVKSVFARLCLVGSRWVFCMVILPKA